MNHNPLISITVCVRNGVQWIDGCLESLKNQTYRPLEIIAVDDGSTDGSTQQLQKWHNPDSEIPVFVFSQEAQGLSAGRNLAVMHAKGEWVAITDIDVRPTQNWITNLYEKSEPVDSNEVVVAVTGRTIFERADDIVSLLRSVEIESKYRSRPRRTSLANGPCSMFHSASLREIGGFDPAWYHAEDMEVSLKLIGNGGTIVYAPEAVVAHVPESGRKRFLDKRSRDARAHVRILRKYPKRRRPGPDFDFIGSSTIVLSVTPLWLTAFLAVLPFLYHFNQTDSLGRGEFLTWWQTKILLVSVFLMIIQELLLWRGPLGVVNRTAILHSNKNRVYVYFAQKLLILQWSLALWKGLILGFVDALTRKNGHDFSNS